jgi:S1-C subfamily serine protease
MHSPLPLSLAASMLFSIVATAAADEPSFEDAASKLAAATVTVRTQAPGELQEKAADDGTRDSDEKLAKNKAINDEPSTDANSNSKDSAQSNDVDSKLRDDRSSRRRRYMLASGVCVGENLIVTAMRPEKGCEFRVTLPGGAGCDAEVCVIDAHSSLVLLDTKLTEKSKAAATPLKVAPESPKIGGRLLAASAWGSEPPTMSQGILGGVDRFIPSSLLPPLLQCDVKTTETSRGAGVVNAAGDLVGIVVAFDGENRRSNWTYLVSGEHVARLVSARKEGQIVELPRRVAHAGMDLRQISGSDALVVLQVTTGGPAEKAGIRADDQIRSLDGKEMHSPFAAARAVASRQPGDKIECVIRRGKQELTLSLTLEESAEEPTISFTGKTGEKQTVDSALTQPKSNQRRVNEVLPAPRTLPDLRRVVNPDIKPASIPPSANAGGTDTLDALRERLKHQEALVKRLEAELAELKRERDMAKGLPEASEPPASSTR